MATDRDDKPADEVRRRAKEERRLLRAEQAAERQLLKATERLAVAQSRLDKLQSLVDRRRARVATALASLRQRQEARAAGPGGADPSASPAAQTPAIPARDDSPPEPAPIAASAEPSDGIRPPRRTTKRRTEPTETSG